MTAQHRADDVLGLTLAEQMLLLMEVRDGQMWAGGSLSAAGPWRNSPCNAVYG